MAAGERQPPHCKVAERRVERKRSRKRRWGQKGRSRQRAEGEVVAAAAAVGTHWEQRWRRPGRRARRRRALRRQAQRSQRRQWSWVRARPGRSWSRWDRSPTCPLPLAAAAVPAAAVLRAASAAAGSLLRRHRCRRRDASPHRARWEDRRKKSAGEEEDFFFLIMSHSHIRAPNSVLTCTMAGSLGNPPCRVGCGLGGWQMWMSLMSEPRKMMYSYTSSRGATGRSVGRSSVPKERTAEDNKKTSTFFFFNKKCGKVNVNENLYTKRNGYFLQ